MEKSEHSLVLHTEKCHHTKVNEKYAENGSLALISKSIYFMYKNNQPCCHA